MRRRVLLLVAAATTLVLVAFLVPLALLVKNVAADRAVQRATVEAQELTSLLAATDRQALALTVCARNARRNGAAGIEHRVADWETWSDAARYDWIVGSDILYAASAHGARGGRWRGHGPSVARGDRPAARGRARAPPGPGPRGPGGLPRRRSRPAGVGPLSSRGARRSRRSPP